MIRFRLAEILKQKGWTPYRLAQVTGLTVPTAYRLAAPELRFGRFTADTLDRLCEALQVQPGDLLEWVPGGQDDGRMGDAQERELARGAR
ncbi:MAG TPA: helix-turn-helix transcriptional regulator [Longimicrobiaceae bacterium]|nr:helix-turn-helix transcriptional regulator [Longimicrobiaceae bacterium]